MSLLILSAHIKKRVKKLSKITVRAGVGTDNEDVPKEKYFFFSLYV